MLIVRAIAAPLVGGVIGYITNDLAIKMLFRPRKAVYIGRFHVPFTPGLIPSQQGRIAESIGEVISTQLLNEETLRQTMLSEETIRGLRQKAGAALRRLSEDQRTVGELAHRPDIRERLNISGDALQHKLAEAVSAKIIEAGLGYTVVDGIVGNRMDFINQNKWLSRLLDDNAQASIREKLAEKVDELIAERAPDAVDAMIGKYRGDLVNARLCDLWAKYQDREEMLLDRLTDLYVSLLGDNLGRLLRAINIRQIVVDKINSLDPAGLEAVIFDIARKELRAIVYLGALLGFMMGFVNLLL